jgi:hypothetical protein
MIEHRSVRNREPHFRTASPTKTTGARSSFVLSCYEKDPSATLFPWDFILDTGSEVSQIGRPQKDVLVEHLATFGPEVKQVPPIIHMRSGYG